jgi:hypothetical protein
LGKIQLETVTIFYNILKVTIMKMTLKLMLLLFGVSFITLMGCVKDDDGHKTTFNATNLAVLKPRNITGIFTATGGVNTSGTTLMVVEPVGTDSIHCTYTFIAKEGTITMMQRCSLSGMTGDWKITSGTGAYASIRGRGTLTMAFAPDPSVPPGALGVDTNIGVVWLH